MHSGETQHYQLPLFVGTDTPKMVDWNDAMTKIDNISEGISEETKAKIEALQNQIGNTELAQPISTQVKDNTNSINDLKTDVESIHDEVDTQDTQINTLSRQVNDYSRKVDNNSQLINNLQVSKQNKLTAGTNITIDENNVISASGGGGSSNYNDLSNKPQINGTTLTGNKSLQNLGIQGTLTAGTNITIDSNNVISASGGSSGTTNYNDLSNKPKINNVELTGNKTISDLGLQAKLTAGENIEITNNVVKATGINELSSRVDTLENQVQENTANIESANNDINAINNKLIIADTTGASTLNIPFIEAIIVSEIPEFSASDKGKIFIVEEV